MKKGFTLLELMIVITIIGVLVSIFLVFQKDTPLKAEAQKNIANFKTLETGMRSYALEYDDLPITQKPVDPSRFDKQTKQDLIKKMKELDPTFTEEQWDTIVPYFYPIDKQKLKPYIKWNEKEIPYFIIDQKSTILPGFMFSYQAMQKSESEKDFLYLSYETSGSSSIAETVCTNDYTVVDAGSNIAYITKNKEIYNRGDNGYGQLGIGSPYGTVKETIVKKGTTENLTGVTKLYAGYNYFLATTEDGKLYGWGQNYTGQMDAYPTVKEIYYATELKLPENVPAKDIKKIIAKDYVLVLLNDGRVLSWGKNTYGELGIGNTTSGSIKTGGFVLQQNGQPLTGVKDIFTNNYANFAIMEDGRTLTWGYNPNQLTGDDLAQNVLYPSEMKKLDSYKNKIKEIAGYQDQVFVLLNDGKVLSWGSNTDYGLGRGLDKRQRYNDPGFVLNQDGSHVSNITTLGGGYTRGTALSKNGELYVWGSHYSQERGDGVYDEKFANQLETVTHAECLYKDSDATLFWDKDEIHAWGRNSNEKFVDNLPSTPSSGHYQIKRK